MDINKKRFYDIDSRDARACTLHLVGVLMAASWPLIRAILNSSFFYSTSSCSLCMHPTSFAIADSAPGNAFGGSIVGPLRVVQSRVTTGEYSLQVYERWVKPYEDDMALRQISASCQAFPK